MIHPNEAVNSLRGFGLFYNSSQRLLADLIDFDSQHLTPSNLTYYVDLAKKKSFSLYWSLDLRYWPAKFKRERPRAHLLYLCERKGLNTPLEALAHLLTSSIAREHREPAAVVTINNNRAQLTLWKAPPEGSSDVEAVVVGVADLDPKRILTRLDGQYPAHARPLFYHLVVVRPAEGPVPFARQTFDRVVLVTDDADVRTAPRQVGNLRDFLKQDVFKEEADLPHFSAFIPTVIRNPAPKRVGDQSASALRRAANTVWGTGHFSTQPVVDEFDTDRRDRYWRLRRDVCVLTVDLDEVAKRWKASLKRGTKKTITEEFLSHDPHDDLRKAGASWARAVTNRQVGLALSGGGAASYRLVPLIKGLLDSDVPIDVVGGVSGGTLLGAYYCALGWDGIKMAIAHGPQFTWWALASIVDSRAIQLKVDYDLQCARVEDLATRLVAITTALRDDRPPQGEAVVQGTLGEAVRVSGSAPIEFGRTVKGATRFSDGASAVLIPARALRDYGADFVFACNAIAGPLSGNPFGGLKWRGAPTLRVLTNFLTHYTELGRFIDAWIAAAFLVEQASRQVEGDANEYAEPTAEELPLLDMVRFDNADELASGNHNGGAKSGMKALPGNADAVSRFAKRWQEAKRSPMLDPPTDDKGEFAKKKRTRGGRRKQGASRGGKA